MPSDPSDVVQVPVKRYEVNLTMQDIMTPLAGFAQQARVAQAAASAPELLQHANELGNLARQVLDVADRLNAVAPHLLSPNPPQRQ